MTTTDPAQRRRAAMHQNGFIKVELPDDFRLHIMSPHNPPGDPLNAQVHDHPFAFDSLVLAGEMRNVILAAMSLDDTWARGAPCYVEHKSLCETSFGPQSPLRNQGRRVALLEQSIHSVKAGEGYKMEPWVLHRTDGPFWITLFHKSRQEQGHGTVYVPEGNLDKTYIPLFLEADQDVLWTAIDRALTDGGLDFQLVLNVCRVLKDQREREEWSPATKRAALREILARVAVDVAARDLTANLKALDEGAAAFWRYLDDSISNRAKS